MGLLEDKTQLTKSDKKERAILVAVVQKKDAPFRTEEYLDELEFLATTSGIETVGRFTQQLPKPDPVTYVRKGKLEEVKQGIKATEADMVIFDDDLTPAQNRNIENELKCKVLDRSLLILDIFSLRAQTAQARLQVELAQYEYLYPRLTRMWTHLERQRGGVGMRGGAGEKELETDRRIIRQRLTILKSKLEKIDLQNQTRRKGRRNMVRVALVGYTNVGKSTLMNVLTKKEDVGVEDKLFATVDSTVRKVAVNGIPFLLTDTVGFIRKLPTNLIESFKSTLDEVRDADILLHVIDASNPFFEEQIEVVNTILAELDSADKPTVLVFNKIDKLPPPPINQAQADAQFLETDYTDLTNDNTEDITLMGEWEDHSASQTDDLHLPTEEALRARYKEKEELTAFISAGEKENISELKQALISIVEKKFFSIYPNYLIDQAKFF